VTLLAQGRVDEALEAALREPEQSARLWAPAIIYHVAGRGAEAAAALHELNVPDVRCWPG